MAAESAVPKTTPADWEGGGSVGYKRVGPKDEEDCDDVPSLFSRGNMTGSLYLIGRGGREQDRMSSGVLQQVERSRLRL